jgi:signal transduction histidine kinase
MNRTRYRQLLAFFVALVLPSIAIASLGWLVLDQQGQLDEEQAKRDLEQADRDAQLTASEIGADMRDKLSRIKAQEIAAGATATDSFSDPSVTLVAWAEGNRLILPWESPEPDPAPFKRAADDLTKIQDDVMRLYSQKPGQAAEVLRAELQKRREPLEREYLRILLRLTLSRWEGHKQEADDLSADLLKLPSDMVDDSSKPQPLWISNVADVLMDEGARERDVLARAEQDLDSFSALARWNGSLRTLLLRLGKSRDSVVARRAETDLDLLTRRMERLDRLRQLPFLQDLQAEFANLDVTPDRWASFPAEGQSGERWFIGMGPASGARALVVAARSEGIRASVKAERRGAGPDFRFAAAGEPGKPLGDSLPGWRVVLGPEETTFAVPQKKLGLSLQQWFYVLSLAFIVALTFFGGHLLRRDARRETRLAELRSQFVSSVSHELKTPLTAIGMYAETLQAQAQPDPRIQAEYLETIVNETGRLGRLLNNVLDFSRIERGQKNYFMQPADLAGVLRSVARTMKFPLTEEGFDFHMEIAERVPPIRMDSDAIEQAVLNLLSNAMKYSGESRRIDLRLAVENESAVIRVMDSGVGIAPEEQPRIFEKFYRVQTPESRAISGTGLGLALVRHIAEAHHGTVEVASAPRRGSTFTIRLPLDSADSRRAADQAEQKLSAGAVHHRSSGAAS